MKKLTLFQQIAFALAVSGCSSTSTPRQSKPPTAATAKPAARPRVRVSQTATAEGAHPTSDVVRRAYAVRSEARQLASDDGPETLQQAEEIARCTGRAKALCVQSAKRMMETNPIAARTGLALLTVEGVRVNMSSEELAALEPRIAKAEELLKAARDEIAERDERQMAEAAVARGEAYALADAQGECETNAKVCRKKCADGEPEYCAALAAQLAKSKPSEAKELYDRACKARFQSACDELKALAASQKKYDNRTAELREDVERAAADIAEKRYLTTFAQKHVSNSRRKARAVKLMREHTAALIKETYCPAVRTFLAERSRAEFKVQAKAHCEERPPSASGMNGVEVELKAECRAVYAIVCK